MHFIDLLAILLGIIYQIKNKLTLSEQFWTRNPKAEINRSTDLAAGFAAKLLEWLTVLC